MKNKMNYKIGKDSSKAMQNALRCIMHIYVQRRFSLHELNKEMSVIGLIKVEKSPEFCIEHCGNSEHYHGNYLF